jgi:hypothetical protein
MTNPIEPIRRAVARRLFSPMGAPPPARALARGVALVVAWARLTNRPLQLDAADAVPALDRESRALLWHVLTETISAVGVLAAADIAPDAGLAALRALADRVRQRVGADPPRAAMSGNQDEAPQIFVLEILTRDIEPCLGRWLPRLDAWCRTGGPDRDWPLTGLCRADLARTRQRLVERSWQIGIALRLPGLDRLLPERAATVPALAAAAELAAAEAAMATMPDPVSRKAGWHIYVEALAAVPAGDQASGQGALGGALAALDALAGEIRAELKTMPPPGSDRGADPVRALALGLLTEDLLPFLAEWRPRYQKFAASERPEAKWRRAEECRAALAATRQRCLPKIRALAVEIGAPPPADPAGIAGGDEEAPLQLPAPATLS